MKHFCRVWGEIEIEETEISRFHCKSWVVRAGYLKLPVKTSSRVEFKGLDVCFSVRICAARLRQLLESTDGLQHHTKWQGYQAAEAPNSSALFTSVEYTRLTKTIGHIAMLTDSAEDLLYYCTICYFLVGDDHPYIVVEVLPVVGSPHGYVIVDTTAARGKVAVPWVATTSIEHCSTVAQTAVTTGLALGDSLPLIHFDRNHIDVAMANHKAGHAFIIHT